MSFDFPATQNFLMSTVSGMPVDAWWLPLAVIVLLGAAAAIDAFTSTVPDALIFTGLFIVTAAEGFYVSWNFAALHLATGIAAAVLIWLINQGWYKFFRRDAIGMGDAKWTMLAVSCFGLLPAGFAWGAGACLAVLWLSAARPMRAKVTHVHFAPFLFAGLCAGLWWLQTPL